MKKYIPVFPTKEDEYYQKLLLLISKMILRATLFGWDMIMSDRQININLEAGEKRCVMIGRWDINMSIRFNNSGTATVNASLFSEPNTMGGSPVVLAPGITNTNVNALGGAGKFFLNFGNTSNTDPATIAIFLPRAGWFIASCSNALYKIDQSNLAKQAVVNINKEKKETKKTENIFLHIELDKLRMNDKMTPAIKAEMQIDAQYSSVPDDSKPEPDVVKISTGYEFTFNKLGVYHGVNIYRTRPGGEKELVKPLLTPVWEDTQTMVDNTVYTFFYFDAQGKEVGTEGTYTVKLNT